MVFLVVLEFLNISFSCLGVNYEKIKVHRLEQGWWGLPIVIIESQTATTKKQLFLNTKNSSF